MTATETVMVTILGKEYQVTCPLDEKQALIESAKHLDERMQVIRGNGKVMGLERIAVIAAINTTYELLQTKNDINDSSTQSNVTLDQITSKLDLALQQCRQMEI